jgi:hypothetical protein
MATHLDSIGGQRLIQVAYMQRRVRITINVRCAESCPYLASAISAATAAGKSAGKGTPDAA